MPDLSSTHLPDRGESPFLRQFGRSQEATEFHSPTPEGYQRGRHRYVAVLGTVMSGLGKGIFSSSVAKLLQDKGLVVAPIKMEGYLNVDSGTLNPFRHGEVFVLDDGTECDMDLGTYERVLDQNLNRSNFVTSGQVYAEILQRERKGGFLGRDVQMIPHVTGHVKLHLRQLAMSGGPDGGPADVVFIEVGGTVGDYENSFYIEALRELALEEGPGSACFVALTYVIEPVILGEQKSKAAQLGIKRLMEAGIQPHIVACRAHHPVTKTVMQKIAMYSNVPMKRVFSMHDRESIYTIPEAMWAEGLDREILSILDLHERVDPVHGDRARRRWSEYADRIRAPRHYKITLGITGKYTAVRDAYASIDRAIEHASTHLSAETDVRWLDTSDITTGNVDRRLGDEGIDAIIEDRLRRVRASQADPLPGNLPGLPDGRDRVRPPRAGAGGGQLNRVRRRLRPLGHRGTAGAEADRGARRHHATRGPRGPRGAGHAGVVAVRARRRGHDSPAVPPPLGGRAGLHRQARGCRAAFLRPAPAVSDHAGAGAGPIGPSLFHSGPVPPGAHQPAD
jgi:hypothetical protein